MDFAAPADHRVKFNESEKKDKYLDLASELKQLWNMKVRLILIVTGSWYSHQMINKEDEWRPSQLLHY